MENLLEVRVLGVADGVLRFVIEDMETIIPYLLENKKEEMERKIKIGLLDVDMERFEILGVDTYEENSKCIIDVDIIDSITGNIASFQIESEDLKERVLAPYDGLNDFEVNKKIYNEIHEF